VAWLVNPVDHTDAYTLAPDPAGGVFVLGESEVFLGAKDDMFLTRLGADGATVWQTLGVGRNVRHIVLAGEQLFFSTEFSGQVRFGGLSADMTGGATDLFVGKMSLGGAWSWGKVIGTSNYDREGLLAPTADGGVIVAHGAFASARKGPFVFKPQGGEDVLVTRLDANAKHVWTRVIATPGYEEPNALLVDAEGDIYLAGTRWQSRDDWMMALASNPCEGFVTRLSPAGEPTWTTGLGGPAGHTTVSSLTLSSDGTLTVRGTAERAVTIAGAALGPKAGGGLFAKVGKDGQIVAARPSEPAVCLAEHPSGVAFGATKTGVFHEDTSGKRTTIVPFAGEGTAVFRCALGGPGRLYVTGRLSPDGTLGGVRAGKPRVNRSPAWLTTYAVGFVGAIDLLPDSHEDVDSGCRSDFAAASFVARLSAAEERRALGTGGYLACMRATPRTLRVVVPLLGAFFVSLQACGSDDSGAQTGTPSAGGGGTAGATGTKAGAGGTSTAGTSAAGTSAAGSSAAGSSAAGSSGAGAAGAAGKSGGATGGNAPGGAAGKAGGGAAKPGEACTTDTDCSLVGIETQPSTCAEAFCKTNVCALRATDTDGDGFRKKACKLVSDGAFTIELGGDCDDGNKDVNPKGWDGPAGDGKPDHCSDGVDQDCSGVDGDAVTAAGASCSCTPDDVEICGQTSSGTPIDYPGGAPAPGSVCALGSRTCIKDPTTGGGKWGPCTNAVGPSPEVCNNKDDDCDGQTDEDDALGQLEWVYDGDGDGYRAAVTADGQPAKPFAARTGCAKPTGTPVECDAAYCGATPIDICCPADRWRLGNTAPSVDCDDRDNQVNPAAAEQCATPERDKDDNCNGKKDEKPAVGELTYFRDSDGDGFGDTKTPGVQQCAAPGPEWKAGIPQTDCDDTKGAVNPSVTKEDCGTPDDDNCNGTTKDGCGCVVGDPPLDCGTPADCVYLPGGSTCVGGSYTACPAPVAKKSYCPDGDADGACNRDACVDACPTGTATAASTATKQPAGYLEKLDCADKTDCDEGNSARTPGKKELCGAADANIDTDCDGLPDNGYNLGATCNVGTSAFGACKNGGALVCSGAEATTCAPPANVTIPNPVYQSTAAPNGSYDWNCDGVQQVKRGFRPSLAGKPDTFFDYCIEDAMLGFYTGEPAAPAPWTKKDCLHPTPDGNVYRVPTCADFTQQATCGTYLYFTACANPAGDIFSNGSITCSEPCGKTVSRVACTWDALKGKCLSASATGTTYIACD
jgi:hypothetical protein